MQAPAPRRRWALGLTSAILVLCLSVLSGARWPGALLPHLGAAAQAQPAPVSVQAVKTVGLTVSDMNQAIAFYQDVLDFRKVSDVEVYGRDYDALQGLFGVRMRVVQMQLGQETLELTEYLTPAGAPIPLDSRSNDLWFQHVAIVVRDMPAAYQRLRQFNVRHVSVAPQTLPPSIPAAAGIEAFYFQDPDRHPLELIHFPPDKGNPRWQQPTEALFLGLDHTAIAIADTPTSLAFYRDLLGLKVAGTSENFGPEQEYLNHVPGARLTITGLQAPAGPGVEFLHYRTPTTGRPRPATAHVNDLLHWDITFTVANLNQTVSYLKAHHVPVLSTRIQPLPDTRLGFRQGCLIQDPDGHVLRLIQP